MIDNLRIINAGRWPKFEIGNLCYYSPNPQILARLKLNPDSKFWLDTYSEFACVIVDRQIGEIRCIRDHFGLQPLFYTWYQQQFIFASNYADIINQLGFVPAHNETIIKQRLANCFTNFATYSDQTALDNIYRVEPGTILSLNQSGQSKQYFWQLMPQQVIKYPRREDYLEHFNHLLNEGIQLQLGDNSRIAAEFSGGLDSSAVISALHKLGLNPELFMHIAPEGSDQVDDSDYARAIIKHYQLTDIEWVDASNFDLNQTIEKIRKIFFTSPEFIFPVCANNIHQAVANKKHSILFSGFGGDECVSGHAPLRLAVRQLLDEGNYAQAWREIDYHYRIHSSANLIYLRRLNVLLGERFSGLDKLINKLKYKKQLSQLAAIGLDHIILKEKCTSLAEYESQLLQGYRSHHIRLRVEESALVGQQFGFNYKYPLLYPKLVEFCFNLPLELKRYNGQNRLMIRNYLAQYLPAELYQKHQKIGGIMPATMDKITREYMSGKYRNQIINLPYQEFIQQLSAIYPKYKSSEIIHFIIRSCLNQG